MNDDNMKHMKCLGSVFERDNRMLIAGEKKYGGSWKKRGGVDTFFMLARKWDRIERQVAMAIFEGEDSAQQALEPYNILEHCMADTAKDGLLDDIGDLRRYLALVEAEVRSRGVDF